MAFAVLAFYKRRAFVPQFILNAFSDKTYLPSDNAIDYELQQYSIVLAGELKGIDSKLSSSEFYQLRMKFQENAKKEFRDTLEQITASSTKAFKKESQKKARDTIAVNIRAFTAQLASYQTPEKNLEPSNDEVERDY